MLKTAATKMYWKQDTRNRTEFSKFLDSNLFPSSAGSGFGGGEYLVYRWRHSLMLGEKRQAHQS